MTNRHPVSPLPFVCMPGSPGSVDGGEDLDVVDEDVVAEHAVGKPKDDVEPGVMPLPSPKPRTEAEWDEHCSKGHVQYHDGCPYCVGGRRPNSHHRRSRTARTCPSLVADYGFLKAHGEEACTFLGALVRPLRAYFSTLCDMKGPDLPMVKRVAQFMRDCGLTKFVYRSDREPAIRALLADASQLAGLRGEQELDEDAEATVAVPETSTPGESQSNGAAERCIQMIEDVLRTLKLALEAKIKAKIPTAHPIVHWLVEHTASMINRCHISGGFEDSL